MSKYKMREAPMRRGLSPEGRAIRERHQASLIIGNLSDANDTSSAAVPTLYKSLDNALSFQGNNIPKLRRCVQPSRLVTSSSGGDSHVTGSMESISSGARSQQPLRATYPLSSVQTAEMQPVSDAHILANVAKLRERECSANSDYFSMNEGEINARGRSPLQLSQDKRNNVDTFPSTVAESGGSAGRRYSGTARNVSGNRQYAATQGSGDHGSKTTVGFDDNSYQQTDSVDGNGRQDTSEKFQQTLTTSNSHKNKLNNLIIPNLNSTFGNSNENRSIDNRLNNNDISQHPKFPLRTATGGNFNNFNNETGFPKQLPEHLTNEFRRQEYMHSNIGASPSSVTRENSSSVNVAGGSVGRAGLRGSVSEENIRSVTDEAIDVMSKNIDKRREIQLQQNQQLSADNPLSLIGRSVPFEYRRDYDLCRGRSSVPSSPRLKPLVTNKPATAACSRDVFDKHKSGTRIIRPINDGSTVLNTQGDLLCNADVTNTTASRAGGDSIKKPEGNICSTINQLDSSMDMKEKNELNPSTTSLHVSHNKNTISSSYENNNICESGLSSPEKDVPTLSARNAADTPRELLSRRNSVDHRNNIKANNKVRLPEHLVPTETYTLSSNVPEKPRIQVESPEHNQLDPTKTYTLSSTVSEKPRNELQSPEQDQLDPTKTYTLSSNVPEHADTADVCPRGGSPSHSINAYNVNGCKLDHNLRSRNEPDYAGNFSHSLDENIPLKDNLLHKLQSGSLTKLIPATFPKPSEFTRSLRNNSLMNQKVTYSRSKPLKASDLSANMREKEVTYGLISQELRQNKVSDLMAKIKENKPTCDVSYKCVQRNIQRQHFTMFGREASHCNSISRPGTHSNEKNSTTLSTRSDRYRAVRSRSADRGTKRSTNEGQQINSVPAKSLSSQEKLMADRVSHRKTNSPVRQGSNSHKTIPSKIHSNMNSNKEITSNLRKTRSSIDLTDGNHTRNQQNFSNRCVPPINLLGINQSSVDETVGKHLHDSLTSVNLGESIDNPSQDAIKLPINLNNDDAIPDDSNVKSSRQVNTLEQNLPRQSLCSVRRKESSATTLSDVSNNFHENNSRIPLHNITFPEDPTAISNVLANDQLNPISDMSSRSGTHSLRGNASNNVAPNIDPCGTPDVADDDSYATSTPRPYGNQQQFDPIGKTNTSLSHTEKVGPSEADFANAASADQHRCSKRASQRVENGHKNQPAKSRSKSGDPPPSYKRGQVPKYLAARRASEARLLAAERERDPACPPNHTPLPEQHRLDTLRLLQSSVKEVLHELASLPIAQDTLRLRNHKDQLEAKLGQLEDGIKIFSQPKVYVLHDEDE